MKDKIKEKAIEYAELGWVIIPVNGKRPLIDWGEVEEITVENVEKWYKDFGDRITGFAFRTGYVEGIFVLDLEADEDPTKFEIPETVCSKSGGGGMHYYFKGVGINSADARNVDLRKHDIIGDFRGNGGLIVAPPSIHPKSNKAYEWVNELDINKLADAPEWLCDIVNKHHTEKVDWEVIASQPVKEGSRHTTATSVAGKILCHFPEDDWDSIGYTLLNSWNNEQCVTPLPQKEIDGIYKSLQGKQLLQRKEKESSTKVDIVMQKKPPMSVRELLNMPESERPEFLIESLIPEHGITAIAGHPGCGKSWLMLEMARAVSSGTKFINEFDSKQQKVLIVDEESGRWEMRRRLELLGYADDLPIHFCCQHEFKLDKKESVGYLLKLCKEYEIGLLILDPFAAIHTGVENNAEEMQVVMSAMQKFTEIGVTVVFIHHHRKAGINGNGQNLRGSSAILGRLDSLVVVEKTSTDGPVTMTIKHTKSRRGKNAEPAQVVLIEDKDDEPKIKLLFGGNVPRAVLKKSLAKDMILTLLDSESLYREELIDAIKDEEGVGTRNIVSAIKELETNGQIASILIDRKKQYALVPNRIDTACIELPVHS